MPKLDEQTQQARRDRILDAAERCFARNGFHRTSIQDICRDAEVSAGALYIYFASKEDLIAGLCERETQEFASRFPMLAEAPDFLAALSAFAEHCMAHPRHKLQMHIEIGAEATRNEKVGEYVRAADRFLMSSFEELLQRVKAEGRIAPIVDCAALTRCIAVIGDGLFWHRALDPNFDQRSVLPALMAMISTLINPIPPTPLAAFKENDNAA
ncbi:MAG: TetR/AcrR family transcriptional regulator [Hyphomicrobiales bacterium]|nr:TetR/AcrR family transcriptional regulator [Hyphomicrobiales bacterium]